MRPTELFLLQIVFYILLWIWNDYVASLVTAIFSSILFFILVISLLVEWIERSKVPRSYYLFMLVSIIAPILVSIVMVMVKGIPGWLEL